MQNTTELKKPTLAPPLPPFIETSPLQTIQPAGTVGFHSLPDQLVRKCTQRGFTFNVLCVGETGIGKSTLLESLFNMPVKMPISSDQLDTMKIDQASYDLIENGVRIKLSLAETVGFGDQLDKEKSAEKLVEFIESQYESWLQEELKIRRTLHLANDRRLHACIYCISPTGHGLKALDTTVLKAIAPLVNVVPVIAKADTTSKVELKYLKEKVLSDFKTNEIDIYYFPTDDPKEVDINTKLNATLPFAVIGSTSFEKQNNKLVRARQYPWGLVVVENPEHCDFVGLREALLRENVEHLRERTHRVLYEQYRQRRLHQMDIKDGELGVQMAATFQKKRQKHSEEMLRADHEMRDSFMEKVKSEEDLLKRRELELTNRKTNMQENFEKSWSKLEEENKRLEEETNEFYKAKQVYSQTLQRKHKK